MYDMNLAEAEINDNYAVFGYDDAKKLELLNTILKKHKVSKQQFDTSLVWYNAHLGRYLKICEQVNRLYDSDLTQLQKEIDKEAELLAERSKVDIFNGEHSFFLQSASLLQNTTSFILDSLEWDNGDNLEISFDILGLDKGMNPGLLCYVHCEDTIIMVQEKIRTNGSFSKLMPYGMNKVKSFSASFHISDSIPNANILINKFRIFHRKNQSAKLLDLEIEPQLLQEAPQMIEEKE